MSLEKAVPMEKVRWRLAKLWFIGGGAIFLILVIQSILGKYGDRVQETFSWFVPTIVPTLALMIGVLGGAAMGAKDERRVSRTFCNMTCGLSVAYLLILACIILLQPISPIKDSLKLYTLCNYFLTPIQGLVMAALGFIFTKQESQSG